MIQENQTVGLFEILKWLLPSSSLFALLAFVWAKYIWVRPKVRLTVKWGGATSSPKDNGSFEFRYTPKLVLHNDSNFVARRITVFQSSPVTHWRFRGQLPGRIDPDDQYEWEFEIYSIVNRESLISLFGDAVAKAGPCQEYFPYALGNVNLILSYDNEKDTTFYTLFTLVNGECRSEFRWRKPRLSSRANGS